MIAIKAVAFVASAARVVYALPTNASLPVVDLEYTLHQATINVCITQFFKLWSRC